MSTATTHIVKPLNTDKLYPDGMIKVESDNAITDYMIGDSVFVFCRNINDYSNTIPYVVSTMPVISGLCVATWRKSEDGIFRLETEINPRYATEEPVFIITHKKKRIDLKIV